MKMDKVEDFLSNFTSNSTIRSYRSHLKAFFKAIKKDTEDYIVDIRRLENGERLDALNEYEKDIKTFWKWMIDNKRTPKTVTCAINCLRVFFKQYRIEFDDIVWDNLRRRGTGSRAVSKETPIKADILKKILIHADAKGKSMFLIMASGGLRVGELVNLKMEDVDFNSKPTKLTIRYTGLNTIKTKTSRIAFISDETTVALKEWLRIRTASLITASKRCNLPVTKKDPNDERVYPYTTVNVRRIWNRILEKADLDEKDNVTDRRMVHIHGLRKYFRTQLSRQNRDVAEILMGHSTYLGESYLRYTEDELRKEYMEGMKYLNVFDTQLYESSSFSDIAKEIISNSAFRTEIMEMIKKELEK